MTLTKESKNEGQLFTIFSQCRLPADMQVGYQTKATCWEAHSEEWVGKEQLSE